jgi:hypothetical protein
MGVPTASALVLPLHVPRPLHKLPMNVLGEAQILISLRSAHRGAGMQMLHIITSGDQYVCWCVYGLTLC